MRLKKYLPLLLLLNSCAIFYPPRQSILFDEMINNHRVVSINERGIFLHETLEVYSGRYIVEKIVDYDENKKIGNHPLDYHWKKDEDGKLVNILDEERSTARYRYLKETGMEIATKKTEEELEEL